MNVDFSDEDRMGVMADARQAFIDIGVDAGIYDEIFDLGFRFGVIAKTIENIEYLEAQLNATD